MNERETLLSMLSEMNQQKKEAAQLVESRNNLHEKIKNLRAEARRLRSMRDSLNEKVKDLKRLREGTSKEIRDTIRQLKELNVKLKELQLKKPSRNQEALQKRLDELEWTIQTTPTDLQREAAYVDEVKQLESQIVVYKSLERLQEDRARLQAGLQELKMRNESCHREIIETAQKSQGIHQEVLATIPRISELKEKADKTHQTLLERREKARHLAQQIKLLRARLQDAEDRKSSEKEELLKKRARKEALRKLSRGDKLTLEEYRIAKKLKDPAQD